MSRFYSCLEVASEYFRSGADKISIGSDAVYAAEEYIRSGVLRLLLELFVAWRRVANVCGFSFSRGAHHSFIGQI